MSSTAKLGAFVLAALVVVGFFIIRIERIKLGAGGAGQRVQAAFPSVAGLDEKAPVRVAGVRVGMVEDIALQRDRALVTLQVDRSLQLHVGARAAVRMLGMLGDQYVELDLGPADAPLLAAGTILEGTSPTGFDKVLDTAGDVGGDVKEITASLRASLGGPEGQQKIDEILTNIRDLTAGIREMVAENRADVAATVGNFREFSASLKTELPRLAEKINSLADGLDSVIQDNRETFSETMENVRDLTASLRTSAENLNEISSKIARGEGTIGKLVNDDTTANNLNATLKSVEDGVSTLQNTIGRVERWKLDVDMRAESLPETDESRSSFGFDLATTRDRFYRFGIVDSPAGRTKTKTEVITTTTEDGESSTITQKTVKSSDDFNFNAQVGYRLGGTTLRAGLFESTGGFGLDQSLFKDKAALSLEVYDFNRDQDAPHIRLEGRYFVTKNFYAFAGYDDPTWDAQRSFLVGGGVRWTDEDFKYFFGAMGSFFF